MEKLNFEGVQSLKKVVFKKAKGAYLILVAIKPYFKTGYGE